MSHAISSYALKYLQRCRPMSFNLNPSYCSRKLVTALSPSQSKTLVHTCFLSANSNLSGKPGIYFPYICDINRNFVINNERRKFLSAGDSKYQRGQKLGSNHGGPGDQEDYIPSLMDFPRVVLPKFTLHVKNKFLSATLIRPYFDKEFTMQEFSEGAKHAAIQISQLLSSGDLEGLEDICTDKCVNTVNRNLSLFSMAQRAELDLNMNDIYWSFVYQIGILMDDEPDQDGHYGRKVEITWVAHSIKNYQELFEEFEGNLTEVFKANVQPTILNFRFIRDFSKNVEDSWTVNALNYFKPRMPS